MKNGGKVVGILIALVLLGALVGLASRSSRTDSSARSSGNRLSSDRIARLQESLRKFQPLKPGDLDIISNIGKPLSQWKVPGLGAYGTPSPVRPSPAPPPAPPPPPRKDRFDLAREACAQHGCVAAVRTLAAHQPRGEAETSLLRRLVPEAMKEARDARRPQSVRSFYPLAREVDASFSTAPWETAVERTILERIFHHREAYLAPDVRADSAARGEWLRTDLDRPALVRGTDGLDWYRLPGATSVAAQSSPGGSAAPSASRHLTPRDNYVLVSAWDGKRRALREPDFWDRLETLRISPLEYQDTKPYWSYLLWRPVQPFAVFMILYVLCTTLFAPRWLGKLLWLLRCKRLARFLHQWACWRQRSASPANLAGKACDYAHAVEWRVHRSMTARARSDLLASAERHLRQASVRQPKVDAWLARILFLQGRLEDAERSAKHAVDHRVHHRGRLELARVLIARGKVASAASQLGAVAWWRTLSADAMWLRAIVAFHGGKLSLARRWLFFARRSRVVRRQSALLVAALRERLGQERQAEKAARQAATSGVGVVSASTWLARRARGRSDHADARRWAALGLSRRPGHAPLELEAAFAGDGGLDALVALVKRHARSAPTLAAVLTFAARTGLRHAYLDARLDDDDDAPAALWEARGDYAHAAGDHPRALAAWAQAAKDDESLTILVRLRGRVLTGEALASERPELALELVRAAKLEGPVARQAARRALYAFLERARRGLPLGAAQTTADAEPEARALFALLQGDAATARALLPDGLAPQLAPLLERERPLCADEVRTFGDAGATLLQQRITPLHQAFARLEAQTRAGEWAPALQTFEGLRGSLRLGASAEARTSAALVEALLQLAAGASLPERAVALELVRAHHGEPRVRALAEHDLAVALTPAQGASRRGSGRWRTFAQAWDRVFASSAYRAQLLQRVLELDDARLNAGALDDVLRSAQEVLGQRLRPFLEARGTDGEPVPAWVHESPLAERAALAYVDDLTHGAETALAAAEEQRKDKQLAPTTWRSEGQRLREACARLAILGVAPERTQALRERTSNAFINLGVDANAVGAYDVAVEATTAALELTRTPENQRLCAGNIAIYENNRARNLPPPGR